MSKSSTQLWQSTGWVPSCRQRPSPAGLDHISQLTLRYDTRLRRHQVPARIRPIIAAEAFLIRIHLQHVLRSIWIMLQRRQTLQRPRTTPMNEHRCAHARIRVAEALQNLRPTGDTVRIGRLQRNPQLHVLRRDGRAVALLAEQIRAGRCLFRFSLSSLGPGDAPGSET